MAYRQHLHPSAVVVNADSAMASSIALNSIVVVNADSAMASSIALNSIVVVSADSSVESIVVMSDSSSVDSISIAEYVRHEMARIRALPPWERALAVSILFDLASVFAALAAKYRDEPQP